MADKLTIDFEYRPLGKSKDDIRVLYILPGVDGDQLERRLMHIPLNDSADYDALSYAWYDPTLYSDKDKRHDLLVNGKCLQIGSNLEAYLRSPRQKQAESRQIWIDAVCIDQKNDKERNAQVLRMREIYQKANQVNVWLGPASNGSDVAVKFLDLVFHKYPRVIRLNSSTIS
jgi:hypothetical protein